MRVLNDNVVVVVNEWYSTINCWLMLFYSSGYFTSTISLICDTVLHMEAGLRSITMTVDFFVFTAMHIHYIPPEECPSFALDLVC